MVTSGIKSKALESTCLTTVNTIEKRKGTDFVKT
jgi:hypothetical protein